MDERIQKYEEKMKKDTGKTIESVTGYNLSCKDVQNPPYPLTNSP